MNNSENVNGRFVVIILNFCLTFLELVDFLGRLFGATIVVCDLLEDVVHRRLLLSLAPDQLEDLGVSHRTNAQVVDQGVLQLVHLFNFG
jgi:hypothetical protein